MEQIELRATTRGVLGKKVRFLRRQGITPTHLFGHNIKSAELQCDTPHLQQVLAQAGKTRLINLKIDKTKNPNNVMVREIQKDPRTGELVHVDFYQVRMEEKIRLEVPVVFIGEAPALKSKENSLLHELNSLTIECLPDKVPANVEVDLSSLTEAEQAIRVKDIALGDEISVLNDLEQMVAKISSRPMEIVEAVEEVAEAPEAPEAAPPPEEESKEK